VARDTPESFPSKDDRNAGGAGERASRWRIFGSLYGRFTRVKNWLWGYDFFVSYHWDSGGVYAVNLAQRLRELNYDVFLDRGEYAMGEDWKNVGQTALQNTQKLILVATRQAVTDSQPVAREVSIFTSRTGVSSPSCLATWPTSIAISI
jgi:hypothetical protein